MNIKILISILCYHDDGIYTNLENTIRKTWAKETPKNVEIIYYYGNHDKIIMDGDKLYFNIPEGNETISNKTLMMFEYINNNFNFDYVFRTNLSSYVNINELIYFIKDKPREKFYSGIKGFNGFEFASGSGYFLSKDLVDLIVRNKNQWDISIMDDLSLGKFMKTHNIPIYEGKRIDIKKPIIKDNIPICYHYRCKTPSDRNYDIILMEKLYELNKK